MIFVVSFDIIALFNCLSKRRTKSLLLLVYAQVQIWFHTIFKSQWQKFHRIYGCFFI